MIPISLIYGNPEDSVNQIAYLEARGYPISYVEMGEEPDGQFMLPLADGVVNEVPGNNFSVKRRALTEDEFPAQ